MFQVTHALPSGGKGWGMNNDKACQQYGCAQRAIVGLGGTGDKMTWVCRKHLDEFLMRVHEALDAVTKGKEAKR